MPWPGQPRWVGDTGDGTVTAQDGQPARGDTTSMQPPPDPPLVRAGQDADPVCWELLPPAQTREPAAASSSPAPRALEPALAATPCPEGSGSGAIINFDLIEGNVTVEPSWPQRSALPRSGRILRDLCKHVGLNKHSLLPRPPRHAVGLRGEAGECFGCGEMWDDKMSTPITGEQGWGQCDERARHHRPLRSRPWGGHGSGNVVCAPLTETSAPSSCACGEQWHWERREVAIHTRAGSGDIPTNTVTSCAGMGWGGR